MRKIDIRRVAGPVSRLAREARHEPVILTTRGRPDVALVSVRDADWETLTVATSPKFLRIVEKSRASLRKKGGIPIEEMRARLLRPKDKVSRRTAARRSL
jgi:PHD/YefM family antitoxin component YafN of YafNO toxin-antitoxin module